MNRQLHASDGLSTLPSYPFRGAGPAGRSAAPDEAEQAQRLLDYLRRRLGSPTLRFSSPPQRLLGGVEALILAFRLADAPPPFEGPLVLRRFRLGQSSERTFAEAGIHDAVRAAGVPTPRCLLHEADREPLGGAFMILDRVDGEPFLGRFAVEALGPGLRPGTALHALREAPRLWARTSAYLGEAALQIATVDPEAVESAIRARGGRPEFLTLDARFARIQQRIEKYGLTGTLAPALDWLAKQWPAAIERRCLVHGDLGPTNLLVRDEEIASVLDWSKALLAEPEAELGFLRISLRTAAIAGLGRWNRPLHWSLSRLAVQVTERFAATRALDPERLRWYETFRAVALLASIAKRSKPSKPRLHVLDGRATARIITREIEQLTGTRLPLR